MPNRIKAHKGDIIRLAVLGMIAVGLVLIIKGSGHLYGSTTDWESQHTGLPEYFRQLFYDTGNPLPSYAANLGSGQNIFYFAYYGLLSPYILLFYLFPFVSAETYISLVGVLAVIVSVWLFYVWLRSRKKRGEEAFFLSLMLLLASPIIFHSHRHVMFIIYMPFLIGALFGVDSYIKKGKFGLLVIMCTLIIFTSFYYSPEALLSVLIVGIYTYIKNNPKISAKGTAVFGFKLSGLLAVSVAMAAMFLFPTAYALFAGRTDVHTAGNADAFSLGCLIPQLIVEKVLYSPYSLGLSVLCVIALLANFFTGKKHSVFLSGAMFPVMLWPFFNYLTNGTLYLNGKTLIPFLPVVILMIGDLLDEIRNGFTMRKRYFVLTGIVMLFGTVSQLIWGEEEQFLTVFVADCFLLALTLFVSVKKRSVRPIFVYAVAFMLAMSIYTSKTEEHLVKASSYKRYTSEAFNTLSEAAVSDKSNLWRTGTYPGELYYINRPYSADMYKTTLYSSAYNCAYNQAYFGIFNNELSHRNSAITNSTGNILFNTFAAQKYIISPSCTQIGYKPIMTVGNYTLYKNDNVLPFGWFTDRTLSRQTFDRLQYPANAEAMIKYAITEQGGEDTSLLTARPCTLKTGMIKTEKAAYRLFPDGSVYVNADSGANIHISLPENHNHVLFIRFDLSPAQYEWNGDRSITINGIKNKLTQKGARYHNGNYTFDYVLSSDNTIDQLSIRFSKGAYYIYNIEFYTLDYPSLVSATGEVTPFITDLEATKGDRIAGTIDAPRDGKLILSLTYDKGYTVLVDGKETPYELANGAFIALDVERGSHRVEICYRAPLLNAGLCISAIALALFLTLLAINKRKEKQ